jgi:hypothetical protein
MVGGGVAAAAGASSFCTGATTCTATTPGSCELVCEDFEGTSTECSDVEADTNCRNTWVGTLGGSCSADFTTSHSGTFSACSDKGSNSLQITTAAGALAYFTKNLGSDNADIYIEFYFNLVSVTFTPDAEGNVSLIGVMDSAPNFIFDLFVYHRSNNDVVLKLTDHQNDVFSFGPTTISTGTWYRLGIAAKTSDNTINVYLNGASEISSSSYTASRDARNVRLHWNGYINDSANVVQYDNIAISGTGLPGTCNP